MGRIIPYIMENKTCLKPPAKWEHHGNCMKVGRMGCQCHPVRPWKIDQFLGSFPKIAVAPIYTTGFMAPQWRWLVYKPTINSIPQPSFLMNGAGTIFWGSTWHIQAFTYLAGDHLHKLRVLRGFLIATVDLILHNIPSGKHTKSYWKWP